MFTLTLDGSSKLDVRSRSGITRFSMDGSAPNPYEGALAALAGCAGVYAHKACVKAGISPTGIDIALKPMAAAGSTDIRRIQILASFPDDFPEELVDTVLASISDCPVKELILHGNEIEFSIAARRLTAML